MLSSPIQLYRKHFSYIASLYSKRKQATMVENTHTEDEKIREDSNEGLDSSSNVVVAVAFAFVAAFVAAAAAVAPPPLLPSPPSFVLLTLLQKQQLCFQNGDDSTTLNAEDRVFRDLFFL